MGFDNIMEFELYTKMKNLLGAAGGGGANYVLYYTKSQKKRTYADLIADKSLPKIINTNRACYAAFFRLYKAFCNKYKCAPNKLTSSWFYKEHQNQIGANNPFYGKQNKYEHYGTDRVVPKEAYKLWIKTNTKLKLMSPCNPDYWLKTIETTINLSQLNESTIFLRLSHERYMVEYVNVISTFYALRKTYPDMDIYLAITLALFYGGASNSHGCFPSDMCRTVNVARGFEIKTRDYGILIAAYTFKQISQQGGVFVDKVKPLSIKNIDSRTSFRCHERIVEMYKDMDILLTKKGIFKKFPKKDEEFINYKLEDL